MWKDGEGRKSKKNWVTERREMFWHPTAEWDHKFPIVDFMKIQTRRG